MSRLKLGTTILVFVLAGIGVFVALSFYSDIREVGRAMAEFKWGYILIILPLALLNYLIRFCKWDYYLRQLGINPRLNDSLLVFLSGLSMSVTPGKLGEVFKSLLLQRLNGTAISKSVPVVFVERGTDALGLLVLATVSISSFPNVNKTLIAIPATLLVIIIGLIRWRRGCIRIIDASRHLPFIGKMATSLRTSYEGAYTLFGVKNLIVGIVLSVVSWTFECLAAYVVIRGFNLDAPVLTCMFVFAFSSLVGAVSMIPGGLIATEASFAGLLVLAGFSKALASSATVITRVCTLWFAVLLGLAALLVLKKRLGERSL
jgi:uncharacterized protein (TIRG00374 family)